MNSIIPVTAAMIRHENRILIAQRKPGDQLESLWEFPGGKLQFGEQPEEGLRREIQEELGMAIEVGELYGVHSHIYGDKQILLLVYWCRPLAGETPRALDVGDFAWVTPDEMQRYSFAPADRPIVSRLQGFAPAT